MIEYFLAVWEQFLLWLQDETDDLPNDMWLLLMVVIAGAAYMLSSL